METTPNPESLKFLPGVTVLNEGTKFFQKGDSCTASPLAARLFSVEGIEGVFFGADFVTITKSEKEEWIYLKPSILNTLMEHFVANLPVLLENSEHLESVVESSDPVIRQIREIIETRVRPAVARDGGDITFDRFEEGIVYLRLQGACSGCPSSSATLKAGIENMLRYYVPEVIEVRAA